MNGWIAELIPGRSPVTAWLALLLASLLIAAAVLRGRK